jgi:hypothetical protein
MHSSRRLFAALTGVAALVAGAAMACTKPPGGHPPGTTTPTSAPTTPTTAPGTKDCGSVDHVPGGPTTTAVDPRSGGAACIIDALAAGTPARFTTLDHSVAGNVTVTVYDVLGRGDLLVTTDSSRAAEPRPLLVQRCTNLSRPDPVRLQAGNCTPQPPAAPPLTGEDCGVIAYASGWPTTMLVILDSGPGRCFQDAWTAGTPARLVVRDQTDGRGGHIRIDVLDVLGRDRLRVVTDLRQTAAGGGVTTQVCTELGRSGNRFVPGGCTGP